MLKPFSNALQNTANQYIKNIKIIVFERFYALLWLGVLPKVS